MMRKQYQPNLGKLHDVTFALYSNGTVAEQIENFLTNYQLHIKDLAYRSTFRKRILDKTVCTFDKTFLVHEATLIGFNTKIGDREFHDISNSEISNRDDLVESTCDIEKILASPGFHEKSYRV